MFLQLTIMKILLQNSNTNETFVTNNYHDVIALQNTSNSQYGLNIHSSWNNKCIYSGKERMRWERNLESVK